MISKEDIKNLTDAFATKNDLNDFREEVRISFSDLLSAVDSYAKKADAYFEEMLLLTRRIDRLEKWVQKIAEETGVMLEY